LSTIKNPRSEKHKVYQLEEIFLLCICVVVSGAEGWQGIAGFGDTELGLLKRFLPVADGIPSAECLQRVMARLRAPTLQGCFVAWARSVARLSQGEAVASTARSCAVPMIGDMASAQSIW